ncbi:GNAT family N-acetyltransferase [Nocardioides sp.]|uniref:GNAT family N-acetyltransferase n=1 Tax=Nocardioides sp. TaxID=35761 RepID=UPI003D10EBE3
MLWRVRTTLPDRPGSLAVLAQDCGDAGVNILGLQIFPGVDGVTDELVLRTPAGWGMVEIAQLIEGSGGLAVSGAACTEHALVDQPTRYVQAARTILAHPARFPEVVAQLFDAEADPAQGVLAPVQDVMEMRVGDIGVQVRRTAPFTPTEHARGAAMADLVSEVLARQIDLPATSGGHAAGHDAHPEFVVDEDGIAAWVEGSVVGIAMIRSEGSGMVEAGGRAVSLRVDPQWQRRGIGTRLLNDVARLAAGMGVQEIVLTTRADNQAVLPMVLAAGLRGRIRMASDVLTVRIPVRDLKPLPV